MSAATAEDSSGLASSPDSRRLGIQTNTMNSTRRTLQELVKATGLNAAVSGDVEVTGVAYDSRAVKPGDLYFCVRGLVSDGHDFAGAAVKAGASALVVDHPLEFLVPQVVTPNVREAMGPIAASWFGNPAASMAVVGVTGTNGKTTTTYLLDAMARAAGRTTGLIGTVETRIAGKTTPAVRTTPESVDLQALFADMRDAGCTFASMEVASHGLHQHRVAGTRFVAAGFTNLTQDHLDYHESIQAYFESKAMLFTPGYTSKVVINIDDEHGRILAASAVDLEVTTYGDDADIFVAGVEMSGSGSTFVLHTPRGNVDVQTPLVGSYNLSNVMCAAGLALYAGLDLSAVAAGAAAVYVPGRLEAVDAGQDFTVLVDYAHTPDAVDNVLRAARKLTSGRLIAIVGCGGDRDRTKRPLMGRVAAELADLAIITSDNPRSEDPDTIIDEIVAGVTQFSNWTRVTDRREAIASAIGQAAAGDVIVIAGKGHETGQTFADRTVDFDDRSVARQLLKEAGCRS